MDDGKWTMIAFISFGTSKKGQVITPPILNPLGRAVAGQL